MRLGPATTGPTGNASHHPEESMPPKSQDPHELSAAEIDLEYKRLQLEDLRDKLAHRQQERERLLNLRTNQLRDFKKSQEILLARQRNCKHRKGGKDNKFARGDSNNFSIIRNTYPTGIEAIMCTRCGKETIKPDPRLRRADPKAYAAQYEEWKRWDDMPTDNTPSGGKIFEIIAA
jgi:hypothetical protein